eukprot:jgi/Hompol1/6819/HPOL_001134-RA
MDATAPAPAPTAQLSAQHTAQHAAHLPPGVHLISHPLVSHKMSLLRDYRVRPKQFRELVNELTLLLGTMATADLELAATARPMQSPVGEYTGLQIKDSIGVFPILRAGQGMVDGFLSLIPSAHVHHLGLYREKATLLPVEYYNKLPAACQISIGFIVDPMIATAGTAIAAVNILKDWGLRRIKLVSILASMPGLNALTAAHPDIEVYVAAVDTELNEHGYIIPGLGDAGDRLFKTFYDDPQ